jgi:hypothetical protein
MPMKNYISFSDWKKDQTIKNIKLINKVSKIIDAVDPHLEKIVKWGQGCWTKDKNHKIYIHCKPDYIQLGFYIGAQLKDPESLLEGNGRFVRHVKIFSNEDINGVAFQKLIKQVL